MAKTSEHFQMTLALSPVGHIYLDSSAQAQEALSASAAEKIKLIFANNNLYGLLHLGIETFEGNLPPSFSFWQSFAQLFIAESCKMFGAPTLSEQEIAELVSRAPFFKGAEYLSPDVCRQIWNDLSVCLNAELKKSNKSLEEYLHRYNSSWNQVGRICFHLAENKGNNTYPFAFLATYTSRLLQNLKVQHVPLKRALQEYADEKDKRALLNLLLPIQKAATHNALIKELVDSGSIYQPLLWSAKQAHQFLQGISLFESSGIVVRIPNWWNPKKPSRPLVSVAIGNEQKTSLGFDSVMDFDLHVALDGAMHLTEDELQEIFSSTDNFIKVKGQWVEVDREKLHDILSYWKKIQHQVKNNGLSFREGVRLFAGIPHENQDTVQDESTIKEWSHVVAGDWLKTTLYTLQNPNELDANKNMLVLKKHLCATLRPYQITGVSWLWLLYRLKLGGCLADDMGLGKTIQIISLMVLIKFVTHKKMPHLLVVPASLLGNWKKEIAQFAPELSVFIAHSSENNLDQISIEKINTFDVIITTYSALFRIPWIVLVQWDLLVLDEAQMIKNPGAKQTRAVKALKSNVRFSLTGTPIENRLADLWSLFDFTSPGLLGSSKAFDNYRKKYLQNDDDDSSHKALFFSALRTLVSPYILRRLKNDKHVIQDLPDKTEVQAYCTFSKQQAALYQQAVNDLTEILESTAAIGIQRQGLILSYILRFKQICNHPDQWLGYGNYASKESGKFLRLQEICEEIAVKQEKVLIFTQFREMIEPLAQFLARIFGRDGLILHGETPVKKRSQLVEAFQEEQGPPFFVLSLKAGGTGLNLTSASHVIHFDRWWNPAVENQATDRAYRIGQRKNVLVHKFICKGTIEEKINDLIASKQALSQEILSDNESVVITKLSNDELIKIVSLDLAQVLEE